MYANFVIVLFIVYVSRTEAFFIRVSNPLEDSLMGASVKEDALLADILHTRNYENAVRKEIKFVRPEEDDDDVSEIEIPETPEDWGFIDGSSQGWPSFDDSIVDSPKVDTVDDNVDDNVDEILQDMTELIDKDPLPQDGEGQRDEKLLLEFLRMYCAAHPDCDDEVLAVELGQIA